MFSTIRMECLYHLDEIKSLSGQLSAVHLNLQIAPAKEINLRTVEQARKPT